MKQKTIPISHRALTQRINRALDKQVRQLRKRKDGYFVVDWNKGVIVKDRVNLEQYGRELGVLNPFETLQR
jgi:hypothetical protein